MNQKGFIPIIILVVGVVALASATFSVVKYKDEIAETIVEIFEGPEVELPSVDSTGGDEVVEETELVEEPIIEEPALGPAEVIESVRPPEVSQPVEPEEAETVEEVAEQETPEEEIVEEIEEPAAEPEEASLPKTVSRPSYAAVRAPSDSTPPKISDIKVTGITENSALVTWHTNENGSGTVEYGVVSNSYEFSTSAILSEAYTGYDHAVSLSVLSSNTIYYYKVISIDNSENHNTARSEENTFLTLLNPPIATSHTNNQLLDAEDYEDFELVGTAESNVTVLIQVSDSFHEAIADGNGDWEQNDVVLQEGENILSLKAENDEENESRITTLALYLDSLIPVTEIWISNYASGSYDFIVNWSSSEYPSCSFDVQYEDQGDWIDWEMNTSLTSKDFTAPGEGTYKFQVWATDLVGNVGEEVEAEIEIEEEEEEEP